MISLRIYQVNNLKSPIDAYRLTTVRVNVHVKKTSIYGDGLSVFTWSAQNLG